ncbi:MAG TPA: M23 family metallopeptidase [Thermoanaerobaculia bacterium]|nr:M23 family metallopeptidase [Thermoanaerobaculia bacterium]
MVVWNLFFSSILLPLIVTALLWLWPRRPMSGWIAALVLAAGITGFSVLAAPWGWFGIPSRFLLAALFVAALIASIRKPLPLPEDLRQASMVGVMVRVLIGFLFGGVALGVLRAHSVPPGAIDLHFPLKDGAYLIGHGGSHPAANHHAAHPAQRYALDIMKLNAAGTRARGIYPADVTRYAIFGAEVLSPCNGTVVSALDGLPDNRPGVMDQKNLAGNHVVVRCGDVNVFLAHLRRGSVAVRPTQGVVAGQRLGMVGNSGNTSEPHLHIHAERAGAGVPARFDGRWLVRNAIVRREGALMALMWHARC